MRYLQAETIVFTDVNGTQYPVKDNLPIVVYDTGMVIPTQAGDDLDEVCSRTQIYGDGSEGLGYAVVDANIVKMMENDFDIGAIKSLIIPVIP